MGRESNTPESVKERSEKFAKDHRAKEVLLYLLGPRAFAAYREHCKGVAPKAIAEKYGFTISTVYSLPSRVNSYIQSLSEVNRLVKSGANTTDVANATFSKYTKAFKLCALVHYINSGEDNILGVKKYNAEQLKKYNLPKDIERF